MQSTAPDRKVYLSRKTSFPLFSPDVGDSWLQLLNLVFRVGGERSREAEERHAEVLNTMVTIGLPVIAEDLEVEVAEAEEHPPYLEYSRDDFDGHFEGWSGASRIDGICEATGGEGTGPPEPVSSLSPHTLSATFDVVDGALFASFVIRGIDVYREWPLEAMSLARLHREVATRLGVGLGASTFVLHSARLRESDWGRTEKILAEHFRRPLPLQVDHSGVFLFGNDGGQARGMLLDHDAAQIFWEEAFDTPEELSWYIVDTMPWLLPQHIRYVGQECSTLKRAIQEGACYEQG